MERIELETPRLHLRAWHDADLDYLHELCSDPLVMRYFPKLLSRDECAAVMARRCKRGVSSSIRSIGSSVLFP